MTTTETEVFFYSSENPIIYVGKLFSLDVSGGFLEFDGYHYVEDDAYPLSYSMFVSETETTPNSYCTLRSELFLIEIYRREKGEDTSSYSEELDEDGEPMNICFFPTCRQKMWFRVLYQKEDK